MTGSLNFEFVLNFISQKDSLFCLFEPTDNHFKKATIQNPSQKNVKEVATIW